MDYELEDTWIKLSFWMMDLQMLGQGIRHSSFLHCCSVLIGSLEGSVSRLPVVGGHNVLVPALLASDLVVGPSPGV